MKIKSLITLLALAFAYPSTASALSYEIGTFSVKSLRFGSDGVYVAFSPALSACGGATHYRMHARVRHAVHANYDAMVSQLLTAYTAGQTFRVVWFDGLPAGVAVCSPTDILELNMLEYSNK